MELWHTLVHPDLDADKKRLNGTDKNYLAKLVIAEDNSPIFEVVE